LLCSLLLPAAGLRLVETEVFRVAMDSNKVAFASLPTQQQKNITQT
jgi:hypothetical protein